MLTSEIKICQAQIEKEKKIQEKLLLISLLLVKFIIYLLNLLINRAEELDNDVLIN